jgi:hypothetical protein
MGFLCKWDVSTIIQKMNGQWQPPEEEKSSEAGGELSKLSK